LSANTGSSVTASPTSTITYTVVGLSAAGCSSSQSIATALITVHPLPVVSVSAAGGITTICEGDQISLTASGAVTYAWTPSASLSSSSSAVVSATPVHTTTYSVTGYSSAGCQSSNSATITIVVNTTPQVQLNATGATICPGSQTTISASGADSYFWSPQSGIVSQNGSTVTVSPVIATTYTVTGSVAGGCSSAPVIFQVQLYPGVSANIISSSGTSICENTSTTLSGMAVGGDAGPYTYSWSSGSSQSNITVSPSTSQLYILTVTDGCLQMAIDSIYINVTPVPNVPILSLNGNSGCADFTVAFIADTLGLGVSSFTWYFGNQGSSSQNPAYYTYTNAGTYDITYSVEFFNGCYIHQNHAANINVYGNPLADFYYSPSNTIVESETDVNFYNRSTGHNMSFWTFTSSSSSYQSIEENPVYIFPNSGYFDITLYVQNTYGCTDSLTKTIRVSDQVTFFIPNAFTPGSDGVNDFFGPQGIGLDPESYDFFVYNRWGEQIFYTNDIDMHWDGRDKKGEFVPQGVYSYIIYYKHLDGKPKDIIGSVLVIGIAEYSGF